MTRVLITGGTGFVGFALARYLVEQKGYAVTLADNLSRGRLDDEVDKFLKNENVSLKRCDLTKEEDCRSLGTNFDYVYHLAAVIGVKNVVSHPERVLWANSLATLQLLDAFKGSSVKKVFFSSTSEVYAGAVKYYDAPIPSPETTPLVLDDIKQRRTTYALSKMFGESACFMYAQQHGLPIVIGRYHNVYGPRMGFAHVIPETFLKIFKSSTIDVPSAEHTRAFCYIDDALDMTVRLTEDKNVVQEIFNIGNPSQEISIKDLVQLMAEIQGKVIHINSLPATAGSPSRRSPDITQWEMKWGKKSFTSLKEGLNKTFHWYKDKLINGVYE